MCVCARVCMCARACVCFIERERRGRGGMGDESLSFLSELFGCSFGSPHTITWKRGWWYAVTAERAAHDDVESPTATLIS